MTELSMQTLVKFNFVDYTRPDKECFEVESYKSEEKKHIAEECRE